MMYNRNIWLGPTFLKVQKTNIFWSLEQKMKRQSIAL